MKKLLVLSFVALFVVALSSLNFADDGAVEIVSQDVVQVVGAQGCCGPVLPNCYSPPFRRGPFAPNYCAPCPVACPTACPAPRPVCAPQFDPCDPCAYPAYGYRTPVRNFLGRVFAPRYYGYPVYPAYGY